MAKLSDTFRQRARRAASIPRRVFDQEARIVRKADVEAVKAELYSRTTLKVTKRMLRSIKLRFLPGGFGVVFDGSIAPHAAVRVEKTGLSKTDGHDLQMDPGAYVARRYRPILRGLRSKGLRAIAGKGERFTNGN
jgi:hypothetical protein